MKNKNMQADQMRGFNKNPYINQSFTEGMNNTMQTQGMENREVGQNNMNPYYTQTAISQNNLSSQQPSSVNSLFGSFDTENFIKGALIGAVGAYLLTNENAQKTIFKTVAKAGDMFGAGIEEMKERMEDAKAELEAEREANA